MASWQAGFFSSFIRVIVRRRNWGDQRALTRRARFLFGAPAPYAWISGFGLRRQMVQEQHVRGEWLIPDEPGDGAVLYVHGGGFVSCSPATHRPIAAALARLTRRRVFNLEYRLAPEHQLPAAYDDVTNAFEWLLSHGDREAQIAFAGDSAGGNLVLGAALRLRDRQRPFPACLVMFSPWMDLSGRGQSVRSNDGDCAMFRPANIPDFARVAVGSVPTDHPDVSPVYADLRDLPPMILHVGSTELLRDDAVRVHEQVQAVTGESHLSIFDDVPHGWQMLPLVPEAGRSLREAAAFIEHHLERV